MVKVLLHTTLALCVTGVFADKGSTSGIKFLQSDYKMTPERLEIARYDKRYVKDATATTFKYNRTCPAVNITFNFNVELGYDLEVIVQAYKFLSNEYRQFPMHFQINLCDAIAKNVLGVTAYKRCGNFTGCPIRKGVRFHVCNWTPDGSMLPPLVPDGSYMLELQCLYFGVDIGLLRLYGSVSRPIGW